LPADTIVKALHDLTHALKGKKNVKGKAQIKTLEKINELLNNVPKKIAINRENHVTFDETTTPPKETNATNKMQTTTPNVLSWPLLTKATIDKPIQNKIPIPRVQSKLTEQASLEQMRLRHRIWEVATNRARLPQRNHMQLRQQEQCKRVQLIHNNKMGEYLNYRQLIRNPKCTKIWSKSAANKFGQLAQGVGGRVKPANTIFFIQKDQVPKDWTKDVTYGSFSCDMKPNKEGKHQTRLTAGGDRINYPEDISTPTADMTLVKTMLNSII
jgi:hypothetical protein